MSRPLRRRRPKPPAAPADPSELSAAVIKQARKSGQLNLQSKTLTELPQIVCKLNSLSQEELKSINVSLDRSNSDEWWDQQPLSKLFLGSNQLTRLPSEIKQLEHLTILELQDNNISELPQEIESLCMLLKLNLSHNKLTTLPECVCRLKDLKVLLVQHNAIASISENINDLSSLDELDLSFNKIKELPESFTFLSRATKVNLSNNELERLPADMDSMVHLSLLDLTNNRLTELPEPLRNCVRLEQLLIRQNRIKKIPVFERGNSLKELCGSFNVIEEFTSEHCESMVLLKVLDLRGNKLQSLPEEITNIQGLERLDIGNNELKSLPNSLGALNHINSLLVEGNPLRAIRQDILRRGTVHLMKYLRDKLKDSPDEQKLRRSVGGDGQDLLDSVDRFTLRSSKSLDFSNKSLSNLDDKVVDLAVEDNVHVLVLNKNLLTVIPAALERLVAQLTEIDLSSNKLSSIPPFFGQAKHLQYLNLQCNQISDLPDELSTLESMRELNICQNRLSKIPNCVYSWPRFEILLAADNSITEIDIVNLAKLPVLATVDFRNNSIGQVPPELGNMKQIKNLRLEGNLFRNPRPAVLAKDTQELLAYLRDRIPR